MLLPIVTYHYVRPLRERFSKSHKFLLLRDFLRQLDALVINHYFIYGPNIRSLTTSHKLNKTPVWLTFDDGYLDHYNYVFPELLKRRAVGSFFIPTKAVFERKLLEVNKVHLILAAKPNLKKLIRDIEVLFNNYSGSSILGRSFSDIRNEHSVASLINDPDMRFVKLLLQQLLPIDLRKNILDDLFDECINRSESAIVDELYLNPDHLKIMFEAGMNIGCHGHSHSRLAFMTVESQTIDINLSLEYLTSIGIDDAHVVVCYPYGSSDDRTKAILASLGCQAAISANLGMADTSVQDFDWLEIPRIDTKFFDHFFTGA